MNKNGIIYKMLRKGWRILRAIINFVKYRNIDIKREFSHYYSVKELVMQQNKEEGYNRLDIFVRVLAIEEEKGLNNYGWNYYSKMQKIRNAEEELPIEQRVVIFKELIKSWEKNGYDDNYEIWLDQNLKLDDGAHRLSLAIYFGLDSIKCHILKTENERFFGRKWFEENGFTENEISNIEDKAKKYINSYNIDIACILWPPAKAYYDDIVNDLSDNYEIIAEKDLYFSKDSFVHFVNAVYEIDDIEQWKIDKKIERMILENDLTVRYLLLRFRIPQFRYKGINGNTLLIQGEKLKQEIRGKYKSKIDGYFHDIICHTGDNTLQSEYINKLCNIPFLLVDYFADIIDLEWMLVKIHEYIDFPNSIPFGKDIDIVCKKKHFDLLLEKSILFFEKYKDYYDEITISTSHEGKCIRIKVDKQTIIAVDLQYKVSGLENNFVVESIERRVKKDGYYVANVKDEICFRYLAYSKNKNKKWHLNYIKDNIENFDIEYLKNNIIKSDYDSSVEKEVVQN